MKLSDLWQSINSVLVKVGITGDLQYFFSTRWNKSAAIQWILNTFSIFNLNTALIEKLYKRIIFFFTFYTENSPSFRYEY